jgi:hypothetical protein
VEGGIERRIQGKSNRLGKSLMVADSERLRGAPACPQNYRWLNKGTKLPKMKTKMKSD